MKLSDACRPLDPIGAAALGLAVGLVMGAQIVLWQHRDDCAEAMAAERECVARLVDFRGRLAELVRVCRYGAGT